MKALVTGGAGLIGSHVVDLLLERGYEVKILDSLEKPAHLNGKPAWIPKDAEFILGDMRDQDAIDRALQGVDYVFHQAAAGGFTPEMSKYFHVNAVGTALLLELIRDKGYPVKKVVVASSQAIYGEGKYECPEHGAIYPEPRPIEQMLHRQWELRCPRCNAVLKGLPTDEVRIDPRTPYAMSKNSEESIAINAGKFYGVNTAALRYSVTYGPRQSISNPYTGVCSIFSTRILNDLPPIVYEDGHQTRDFIYVRDVAEANLLVAEREDALYEAYNVGTGKATSVLEFIQTLASLYGREVKPVLNAEFRPGEVRHLFADGTKLRSLGWEPKIPLKEGLARYRDWITTQGDIKEYFTEAEALLKKMQVVRKSYDA